MARVYRKGERRTIRANFARNGAPYDPDTVTLTVTPPRGPKTVLTFTGTPVLGEIMHDSPGTYTYDIGLTTRGTWYADWSGVGSYVDTEGRTRPYSEPVSHVLRVYL